MEAMQVPVLRLVGEQDRYNNCCPIEHMREIHGAAKARSVSLERVVYPYAGHAFDPPGRNYRGDDAMDAGRRVSEPLAKHQPLN